MKEIYVQIISEGTGGVSMNCGDNNKGENLAFIAQVEIYNQLRLFPEMLKMLKEICDNDDIYYKIKSVSARVKLRKLIDKAEGGK